MPVFRAGRDLVRLEVSEPVVLEMAAALWAEAPGGGAHADELQVRIEVVDGTVEGDPEEELRWEVSDDETRLRAPGIEMTVRPRERIAAATVAWKRGAPSSSPLRGSVLDITIRSLLATSLSLEVGGRRGEAHRCPIP